MNVEDVAIDACYEYLNQLFLLRFVQSCCLPEDKLSYIRSSQGLGNKICMINAVTGTLKYPLNFSWVLGDAEVDEDEE